MREDLAKQYIIDQIRVTRSDIAEAKAFALERHDHDVHQWLDAWVHHHDIDLPERVPIHEPNPIPALDLVARWLSLRLGLLEAVMDLYQGGLLLAASSQDRVWPMNVSWTDTRPGQRGSSGGWTFSELAVRTPTRLRRPWWADHELRLSDGDLLVRQLAVPDLHPGVAEALRQAARCFRTEQILPGIAMLSAASEGSWVELGRTLAALYPDDQGAQKTAGTLESSCYGPMKKIDTVLELYERACSGNLIRSSRRDDLRGVAQWSNRVRDGSNVLHWGKETAILDADERAATLLLAAVPNIRLIYEVRAAARSVSQSPPTVRRGA